LRGASSRQKRKSTREDHLDARPVKKQRSSEQKDAKPGNIHLGSINMNISCDENLPVVDVAVTDVSVALMDKLESTVVNIDSDKHRPGSDVDATVTEASEALIDKIESIAEDISSDDEDTVERSFVRREDYEENESMVVNVGSDEDDVHVSAVISTVSVEEMSDDTKPAAAAAAAGADEKELELVADDVQEAEFKQKSMQSEESKEGIVNISSDDEDVADLTVTEALESISSDDEETVQCTSVPTVKDESMIVNVSSDDDEGDLPTVASSNAVEVVDEEEPDDAIQGSSEVTQAAADIASEQDDELANDGPDVELQEDSLQIESSEGNVQLESMIVTDGSGYRDLSGLSVTEALESIAEDISSDEETAQNESIGGNTRPDSIIANQAAADIASEQEDELANDGPDVELQEDSLQIESSEGNVQLESMIVTDSSGYRDLSGLSVTEALESIAEDISSDEETLQSESSGGNTRQDSIIVNVGSDDKGLRDLSVTEALERIAENISSDEETMQNESSDGSTQLDSIIVNVGSDEEDLPDLPADAMVSDMSVEVMDKQKPGDTNLPSDGLMETADDAAVADDGDDSCVLSDAVFEWLQSVAAGKQSSEARDHSSATQEAGEMIDPSMSETIDPSKSSMLSAEVLESVSNDSTLSLGGSESFTVAECDKQTECGTLSMEPEAESAEVSSGGLSSGNWEHDVPAVTDSEQVSEIVMQEHADDAVTSSSQNITASDADAAAADDDDVEIDLL